MDASFLSFPRKRESKRFFWILAFARMTFSLIFLLAIGFASFAMADEVPIEDLSEPTQQPVVPQQLSLEQRIARLEQQMQNSTQMNLPAKMDQLQQQMQQLQGEIDTEKHDIQLLNEQLQSKNSYVSTPSSTIGSVPQSSLVTSDQDQTYKDAFNLLKDKKYDDAVNKMQAYLNDYPNGEYVANAHYWLGEIYYLQSQLPKSIGEFQVVINQYLTSTKVPDSMLKLAMIYSAQGDYKKSHQEFQQIKDKYPDSTAAHLVENQIQKTS